MPTDLSSEDVSELSMLLNKHIHEFCQVTNHIGPLKQQHSRVASIERGFQPNHHKGPRASQGKRYFSTTQGFATLLPSSHATARCLLAVGLPSQDRRLAGVLREQHSIRVHAVWGLPGEASAADEQVRGHGTECPRGFWQLGVPWI